jgi:hypothetical protein
MIDSIEVKEFDDLEERLLEADVSYGEMTREYARYLLDLIQKDELRSIDASKLEMLVPFLEEAMRRERIESDEGLRKKLTADLWKIEQQNRKIDEGFANFIRGVLYCYGTEEVWEQEGDGPTPIYLYFLILKKILPGLRKDFINSFNRFIERRS